MEAEVWQSKKEARKREERKGKEGRKEGSKEGRKEERKDGSIFVNDLPSLAIAIQVVRKKTFKF